MSAKLDLNQPHETIRGDSMAAYSQNGKFFTGGGAELTREQRFMSIDEFQKKYPDFSNSEGNIVEKESEETESGMQGLDTNTSVATSTKDEPEETRESLGERLEDLTAQKVKKIVEETKGIKPITGRGAKKKNIELLLTNRFGPA